MVMPKLDEIFKTISGKDSLPDPSEFLVALHREIMAWETRLKVIDDVIHKIDSALKGDTLSPLPEKEEEDKRKQYPMDLRFDAARTRLQRFMNIFEEYKQSKSKEDLERLKKALDHLRQVYVCSGCEQIENYIAELLQAIEKGEDPDKVIPVIESYVEGLLFSIEATNVMMEKWGYVKSLEELTKEEKEFLRREVEKRLGL